MVAFVMLLLQRARRAWTARALHVHLMSLRSKPLEDLNYGCFRDAPVAAGSARVDGASPFTLSARLNNRSFSNAVRPTRVPNRVLQEHGDLK